MNRPGLEILRHSGPRLAVPMLDVRAAYERLVLCHRSADAVSKHVPQRDQTSSGCLLNLNSFSNPPHRCITFHLTPARYHESRRGVYTSAARRRVFPQRDFRTLPDFRSPSGYPVSALPDPGMRVEHGEAIVMFGGKRKHLHTTSREQIHPLVRVKAAGTFCIATGSVAVPGRIVSGTAMTPPARRGSNTVPSAGARHI